MEVILLKDVRGIGRRMERKTVSDGYARNFLIAKKIAIEATPGAIADQKRWDTQNKERQLRQEELKKKLKNEIFEFRIKLGKAGEIFGGVNQENIQKLLTERGYRNVQVTLKKAIRQLGAHEVGLIIDSGVKTTIHVTIIPEEQ